MTPSFDPKVTQYTATTNNATNTITATTADAAATVTIKVGEATVESGSSATWASGENIVTITVKKDKAEKVYTVEVNKT